MPSNEKLTRLGIFVAVGYLCAGVLVSLLASLPYWLTYFSSNSFVGSVVILVSFLLGATVGIAFMRLFVSRYGVKPVFEQDLLIAMIGLLFMTIAINQTMLMIGLLLTAAGLTVFFIGNAKVQANTARAGGSRVLALGGWALGPLIAVIVIATLGDLGSLPLRVLFAHYLLIAFWVWIQRFSLHFDYHDAPDSIHKLVKIRNKPQAQTRQPIKETYRTKPQTASATASPAAQTPPQAAATTATSAAAAQSAPSAQKAQAKPNTTTNNSSTPKAAANTGSNPAQNSVTSHTTTYTRTTGSAAPAPNSAARPRPTATATSHPRPTAAASSAQPSAAPKARTTGTAAPHTAPNMQATPNANARATPQANATATPQQPRPQATATAAGSTPNKTAPKKKGFFGRI